MPRNLSFISWISCAAAVAAWCGVILFGIMISNLQSGRSAQIQSALHQSSQESEAALTHSFVTKSAGERAQLDTLAHVDPSAFAQLITSAGSGSGIAISITSATQGQSVALDSTESMNSYVFLASAHGAFDSVMQAGSLLQTIPAPASIQQIEFTHEPPVAGSTTNSNQWVMNAQILVYSESST